MTEMYEMSLKNMGIYCFCANQEKKKVDFDLKKAKLNFPNSFPAFCYRKKDTKML